MSSDQNILHRYWEYVNTISTATVKDFNTYNNYTLTTFSLRRHLSSMGNTFYNLTDRYNGSYGIIFKLHLPRSGTTSNWSFDSSKSSSAHCEFTKSSNGATVSWSAGLEINHGGLTFKVIEDCTYYDYNSNETYRAIYFMPADADSNGMLDSVFPIRCEEAFNNSNTTTNTFWLKTYLNHLAFYMKYPGGVSGSDRSVTFNLVSGNLLIDTFTLNYRVPPTFQATNLSYSYKSSSLSYSNTTPYATVTKASTTISNAAASCYGTISSSQLQIGSIISTGTGNGTITTSNWLAAGTFTPTVTVTDSRGISATTSLSAITVKNVDIPPTLSPGTLQAYINNTSTNYIYTRYTSLQTNVSNIKVAFDGTVSSIQLHACGKISTSRTTAGALIVSDLTTAGSFTPFVRITDSWGLHTDYPLTSVNVLAYLDPNIVSLKVYRVDTNKKLADEGERCMIELTVSFTNDISTLIAPTTKVDGTTISVSTTGESNKVTWFKTWNSQTGTTTAINWAQTTTSTYTIYGYINKALAKYNTFSIALTAKDSRNNSSAEISERLGPAFYTVDFLAGGYGIAFGQLAYAPGFYCNMDSTFGLGLYLNIDESSQLGIDDDLYQALNNTAIWGEVIEN